MNNIKSGKIKLIGTMALIGAISSLSSGAIAKERTNGRGTGPVVYVVSTGLFHDSFVVADLPQKGRFQQLMPGVGPSGFQTDYGPGSQEYVGGRWWIDANPNGIMDDGDAFFLCPL
ncbi:MAG: hypothetical protein IMF06_03710, partial [Proteobacteria bacterium]|nr:hypothetical protein [Pseudomonadota bacterium]